MTESKKQRREVELNSQEKSVRKHDLPSVLVIEDDEGLNLLIQKKIRDLGFKVEGMTSGKEAIERVHRDQNVLLLLDYLLPDMKGEKVILDAVTNMFSIPFIVMTGHGDQEIAVLMMKLGARDYLVKDANFMDLLPEVVGKVMREVGQERKMEEIKCRLEESKNKFRLLFNHGPDMFFSVHPELGVIMECNRAAVDNLGFKKEELVGSPVLNIYHPDSRKAAEECLKDFVKTGSVHGKDLVVKKKDGSKMIVELKAEAIRNNEGKILYSMSSIRDITERKKAEVELTNMKEWSETVIDLAPNMIIGLDRKHRIVVFNKYAEELTGYSAAEVTGKDWVRLFIPRNKQKTINEVFGKIEKGKTSLSYYENPITTKNNETRLIAWHNRLLEENNRFRMVLSIGMDITEQKKAERDISDQHNLIRTLIDNMPDYIYVKDLQSRFILSNLTLLRRFGLSTHEELKGKCDHDFYDKSLADKYRADDRKVIESGMSLVNREETTIDEYNNEQWILTTKVPIKDEYGNVTGIAGIGRNITQLKKHEQEIRKARLKAEESDRLKSAFLLNLSHEVRTPLNAIMGFSNLLSDKISDNAETKEFAKHIDSAGKDLLKIIEDTIDMAKLENNQVALCTSNSDITRTVREVYSGFLPVFTEKKPGIKYILKIGIAPTIVNTDHEKLRKVISKLLDNACKFTEEGKVELGVNFENPGRLLIYVKDTGLGIPEEMQDAVFEKFTKHEHPDELHRGTGLGLPIARGLLELMGGTIELVSEYGKGSTFQVCLPVIRDQQ